MAKQRSSGPYRFARRVTLALGTVALLGLVALLGFRWHYLRSHAPRYASTGVRRADLFPTTTASGRIESAKRTVIQCALENITIGVRGQRLAAGGASVLLQVIPEGSEVKRGDVLAVLDSSDYEELLRTQKITVERAKTDKLQAELDYEVARMAVTEFKEGTMRETVEDFEGNILLARSDLERATDRLNWSRRMKAKGYVPAAMVSADAYREAQAALNLKEQEKAFEVFKRFTAAKTVRQLEGAVKGAEATLEYQELRLQRNLDRLAFIEEQVELCTIRAPHDGLVVYANKGDRDVFIEPGMPVRQWQDLFYLPDLTNMEVVAMLHESIVDEVGPGMPAKIQVEGLGDRRLEGHLRAIAPIPSFNWRSDVRYFEGIVKLENPPRGLRPGMTAEVEIDMPRRESVLAVPPEAVAVKDGHDVCFVIREDGLEERQVRLGYVTRDMAEITAGLEEGEQVVLNPVSEDSLTDTTVTSSSAQASSDDPTPRAAYSPSVIAASH